MGRIVCRNARLLSLIEIAATLHTSLHSRALSNRRTMAAPAMVGKHLGSARETTAVGRPFIDHSNVVSTCI